MYPVYRIQTFEVPDNAHKTGRTENWVVQLAQHFETETEAKLFICEKSRSGTFLPNLLIDCKTEAVREAFTNEFCFDNDLYLRYRRYFIGFPPLNAIRAQLTRDGIQVQDRD